MPRTFLHGAILAFLAAYAVLPFAILSPWGIPGGVEEGIIAASISGGFILFCALLFILPRSIQLTFPKSYLPFLGLPLFVVACVSAISIGYSRGQVWGAGFDLGTVGFFALFALSMLFAALIPRHLAPMFLRIFLGGVALFSGVFLVALTLFQGSGVAVMAIVSWPQLAFLLGAALLVSAAMADAGFGQTRYRYGALALFFGIALVIFFHPAAVVLVFVLSALYGAFVFWERRRIAAHFFPVATLLAATFTGGMLLVGVRSPVASVQPDVRPSLTATEFIIVPAYMETMRTALIGTGPHTLPQAWERYRPPQFNRGVLWSTTVSSAHSAAASFAIELGALGLLALALCPILLVVALPGRRRTPGVLDDAWSRGVFILTLFSLAAPFVYPLSASLFIIGAVGLGLVARLFSDEEIAILAGNRMVIRILVSATLVLAGGGLLWISAHQFVAAKWHAEGSMLLESDPVAAASLLERAAKIWPLSSYERDASRAILASTISTANTEATSGSVDAEDVREGIDRAATLANRSVVTDPSDYRSWLSRAVLFISLKDVQYPGAEEAAQESLNQAAMLAPARPDVPYFAALLALRRGDLDTARGELAHALELKPDYADAEMLLETLK